MATKNDKTINVKWSHNGAYRRFQISGADDVDIYEALLQKVRSIIPDFNDCFAWNDEDGDEIVFSSYAEMKEALALPLNQNLFRIYTVAKPSTQPREAEDNKDQTKEEKRAKVVHNGVVCDECDKEVVGIRYKCAVCDDYDLCEECERKGKHSQHSMIRYATPFYGGCGRGRCRRGCHHPRFHHAAGFRSPFATGLVTSYPAMATQIATAANEAARTAAQYAASTLAENMARASAAATGTAPPPPPPPPQQPQQNANSQHVPPQPPPPPNPFGNIVNGMDFLREIGTQVQQALSNFGIEVDMDVEHGGQTERVPRPSQTSSNNNNNNNDNNNTNNDNNNDNNNNTDKSNGNDKQKDETPKEPTNAKEVNADSGDVVMTPAHTDDVVTEPMSEMHISNDKEPEQQADKTVGDKENGAKEPEGSEKEKGNVMLVDIDDEGNDTEMWTMMDKNDVETTAKTNDAGSVEKVYPNLSDIGIKCMAGTPFITPLPGPHNPHCPLIAPDRQVATCVEQLEAMGFDNCNGWLTKLAMVHQGDATRVIENLGSDPVYSQRLQAAL